MLFHGVLEDMSAGPFGILVNFVLCFVVGYTASGFVAGVNVS